LRLHLQKNFPSGLDVDGIVQESYLRTWKAGTVLSIRSAQAYLFQVAKNLALGWMRHRKVAQEEAMGDLTALRIVDERPNGAEAASANEKLELAVEVLMTLPPRTRETVIMRKLRGLSQKETAEALGVSVKTVDKLLATGLAKLEVQLRRQGVEGLFDR